MRAKLAKLCELAAQPGSPKAVLTDLGTLSKSVLNEGSSAKRDLLTLAYGRVYERFPHWVCAYQIAAWLFRTHQYSESVDWHRRAFVLAPDNEDVVVGLVLALVFGGMAREAIATAYAHWGKFSDQARADLARAMHDNGTEWDEPNYASYAKELEKAIAGEA